MKKLYAPWRSGYVTSDARSKEPIASPNDCVFCRQFAENNDTKHFILKRGKTAAIIMNLYPYNAGHLLIIPYGHHATLDSFPPETRAELMELMNLAIERLKEAIKPEGFNVGANFGKASGAGIPAHLHLHVLPRWEGDTNFLPMLAETKPVSFDLHEIYKDLKAAFED